jgi:hypothetical protein
MGAVNALEAVAATGSRQGRPGAFAFGSNEQAKRRLRVEYVFYLYCNYASLFVAL